MKLGVAAAECSGLIALFSLCGAMLVFGTGAACGKTGLSADEESTVRDYQVEQLLCVDKAKTLEESQTCRCHVKAKYGRPCELPRKDGGL